MFRMFYWCMVLAITAVLPPQACQFFCSDGRYIKSDPEGKKSCIPCPGGSFMPGTIHGQEECFPCTKVNDTATQEVVSECTRSHDAVVECKEGHFRKIESPLLCQKCRKCSAEQILVHNCSRHKDKVCCKKNSAWLPTEERCLILCGRNTYYNASADKCLPCPSGTFLDLKWHTEEHCMKRLDEVQSMRCAGIQYFNISGVLCRSCQPGTFQNLTEQASDACLNVSGETSTQPAVCPESTDEDLSGLACWKWILIVSAGIVVIIVTTDIVAVRLYKRRLNNDGKTRSRRRQPSSVFYWAV